MRRLSIACAVILTTALAPAVTRGQDPVSGNDPSAGSPAGTIYQIPLDTARHDAAPRTKGGGGGTGSGSPLRSENNFGSSSQVPGASKPTSSSGGVAGATSTSGGTDAAAGSGGGAGSSGGRSAGGSGSGSTPNSQSSASSSQDSASSAEALIRAPGAHPSSARTYLLLAAAVAVALALAAAGRLLARRR